MITRLRSLFFLSMGTVAVLCLSTWISVHLRAQDTSRTKSAEPRVEFIGPVAGIFSQAAVVHAGGVKTIHLSGIQGKGDTLIEQSKSALERIEKQLASLGAKKENIVKLTVYVVNLDAAKGFYEYGKAQKEIFGDAFLPACTMVGVTSLVAPGDKKLVEIDATAIAKD